ncbi:hypothetical protein [Sphingomonas jaspsi]|uniref:hypothetical protein n=1 Tax=Sphingomonas jaspsi TaxID=392409 RepID=UPI0004BB59DB|nr:hypothetical protein [Sphingomonas jaspsi]
MVEPEALVDNNGDIHLHGRQGAVLTVEFTDITGALRNMVGTTVMFEVGPNINVALTNVVGQPAQMQLTLTQANVKAIYQSKIKDFIFLETSAAQPTPLWTGVCYVTGWVE